MSMQDLLLHLSQISSALYLQTAPPPDSSSSCCGLGPGFDIPDFLLPFPDLALHVPSPDTLVSSLVDAGASLPLARELSRIHSKSASELADHYSQNYRNACLDIANANDGSSSDDRKKRYLRLQQAGRRMYTRTIASWEKDLVESVKNRFGKGGNGIEKQTTEHSLFNSNFNPILEEVFNENPFPSPTVKRALAQKSGMSMRQINVWFQNHRSRARKEGRTISKTRTENRKKTERPVIAHTHSEPDNASPHKPDPVPTLSDCETVIDSDYDTDTGSRTLSRSSSVTLHEDESNRFTSSAPSYAFPTPYPPQVEEHPFPCRVYGDFSFPKPSWTRVPYSTSTAVADVDIPRLVEKFSKLNLEGNTVDLGPKGVRKGDGPGEMRHPSINPFLTSTYPAPLPSLVSRPCKRYPACATQIADSKDSDKVATCGNSLSSKDTPAQTMKTTEVKSSVEYPSASVFPAGSDSALQDSVFQYKIPGLQQKRDTQRDPFSVSSKQNEVAFGVSSWQPPLPHVAGSTSSADFLLFSSSLPLNLTPREISLPNDGAHTAPMRSGLDSWELGALTSSFPVVDIPLPCFVF